MNGVSILGRRLRPGVFALSSVVALLVLGVGVLGATSLAYGSTVRGGERLLPGTTIASIEVGELPPDEARERVAAHLDTRLDRTISVADGDTSWTLTPRQLEATTDLDDLVATAIERTEDLSFTDLVELRWLGASDELRADVRVSVPDATVAAFVADIAADVDREPRDAEVAWADDTVQVSTEGRAGREVVRDEAVDAVAASVTGTADEVELPVEATDPDVPTDLAEEVADTVAAAVDERLDRTVTVELDGGDSHSTSARELGAEPTIEPLVAAALANDEVDPDELELAISDEAIAGVLDAVTAGSTVAAQDASLEVRGGEFQITPEVVGAAVDRDEASGQIRAALDGAADHVGLDLQPVRPSVTAEDLDQVLVVDHSSTTLTLYRGGEAARSWPVAVGTNDSPTPTGTFVIGAMRYEPTWVNPAQDRWGKDMPARVGPGPDNPLGARAINWNTTTDGRDTLIRFHGTPNEASIGTAASNGCVRMYNQHVIELYDLVSSGTTIVSKH